MPKPVVSAVNGPCAGIGMSLALAADLVVARQSAYFLLAFVNIGLVPDGGSSFFVPTRIGFARAAEMAMLGERIPARAGARVGPDQPRLRRRGLRGRDGRARRSAWPPARRSSYAGTKRQLNAWLYGRMEEQLELEAAIQQEMAAPATSSRASTAFVQKRTAVVRRPLSARHLGLVRGPGA